MGEGWVLMGSCFDPQEILCFKISIFESFFPPPPEGHYPDAGDDRVPTPFPRDPPANPRLLRHTNGIARASAGHGISAATPVPIGRNPALPPGGVDGPLGFPVAESGIGLDQSIIYLSIYFISTRAIL